MFARFLLTTFLISLAVSCQSFHAAPWPKCGSSVDFKVGRQQVSSQRWMKDLKSNIGNVKLSQMKIPATHDSGTYGINDFRSYSNDISSDPVMALIPTLVAIFTEYGLNTTNIKSFIAPWMRTQRCSIKDQLTHGVRHLDLRVCISSTGQFQLCHALSANNVSAELSDIKQWSDSHPGELISMDFNHLYGFATQAIHQAFANMVLSTLGQENIATLTFNNTYNEFVASNKRFKLFYQSSTYAPLLLAEPSANIVTPWANVQDMVSLKAGIVSELASRNDFTKGFVSQILLTPSLNMMINGIVTNLHSVAELSQQQYSVVSNWVQSSLNHTALNVINTDFYYADFIKQVISLNVN